jgi:hypothetical protein
MHTALRIPELLSFILASFDPKSVKPIDLLNCAPVRRDWAWPALSILWRSTGYHGGRLTSGGLKLVGDIVKTQIEVDYSTSVRCRKAANHPSHRCKRSLIFPEQLAMLPLWKQSVLMEGRLRIFLFSSCCSYRIPVRFLRLKKSRSHTAVIPTHTSVPLS